METEIKISATKMNAIIKTIYERRAVRKYKDMPVDGSLIRKIIEAGRMAPSAMNKQPWRFHVLTSEDTIRSFSKEIARIGFKKVVKAGPIQLLKTVAEMLHFSFAARILKGDDMVFYGAPVVIFISAPKDNEWAALDVGMCAQNMMLTARSLGLDSCPIGFGKFVEQTKIYPRLNVPASDQVHLAIIFGYGNETPELHKRRTDNIFFVDPV